MDIRNGFIRTTRGKWINLERVVCFEVQASTTMKYTIVAILDITASTAAEVSRQFTTEREAQVILDNFVESRWTENG